MDLSPSLNKIIGSASWERNTIGMSEADVFKLTGIEGGGNAYLKVAPLSNPETLKNEMEIMSWLFGKILVPNVLHFEIYQEIEYLLLSEIEGENLKDSNWGSQNPVEYGRKIGEALLAIHSIDISECPFDATLKVKLNKALQRIESDLVDPNDFDPLYLGKTPEEIFSLLKIKQPEIEDLVFTHGDFSLANILGAENGITGFVDWGRAGISDRHQDIGIIMRSLKNNTSDIAVEAFIDTYGRENIDFEKMDYFILLDELF